MPRHVPGSTRSCPTPFPDPPPPFGAFRPCPQNAYIMHTKCIQISKLKSQSIHYQLLTTLTPKSVCIFLSILVSILILILGSGYRRMAWWPQAPTFSLSHFLTCTRTCVSAPLRWISDANETATLYKTEQNRTISDFARFQRRCTNDLRQHRLQSFGFCGMFFDNLI